MATVRLSINPEDNDHQVVQAAGAAVATKNIELTIDIGTLSGAGMSANMIRSAVVRALNQFEAYLETSGKFLIQG